jgi:tripartite-type tricarboxylate transporter receptor subunit TctC
MRHRERAWRREQCRNRRCSKDVPDGYTLVVLSSSNAVNATLYDRLNFNLLRDFAPVAGFIRSTFVMEVHPSLPVTSGPEFIAYADANPGRITMASAGIGSAIHMTGELFRMMTGVNPVHIPYRGEGPAVADPYRRTGSPHVRHAPDVD